MLCAVVVTQGTSSGCCREIAMEGERGLGAAMQRESQRCRMDLFPKHRQLNALDGAFVQAAPPLQQMSLLKIQRLQVPSQRAIHRVGGTDISPATSLFFKKNIFASETL